VEGLVRMFEPNIYINILDRDKSILEEILKKMDLYLKAKKMSKVLEE